MLIQSDNSDQKNFCEKPPNRPSKRPAVQFLYPPAPFTRNSKLGTRNSPRIPLHPPPPQVGQTQTDPAPDASRDSEDLYQQHLQDLAAAGVNLGVGRESTRRAAAAQAPPAIPAASDAPPAIPEETAAPSSPQPNPLPEDGNPPPSSLSPSSLVPGVGPRSPVPGLRSFSRPRSSPPVPNPHPRGRGHPLSQARPQPPGPRQTPQPLHPSR